MPTSWASKDNPGLYVYAPAPDNYPWSPRAWSPTPRAHYVCHCGAENRALGERAVKALISEYLTHMRTVHADVPETSRQHAGRRAA